MRINSFSRRELYTAAFIMKVSCESCAHVNWITVCLTSLYSFCSALQGRADYKPDCFIIRQTIIGSVLTGLMAHLSKHSSDSALFIHLLSASRFALVRLTCSRSENSPRPHSSAQLSYLLQESNRRSR